MGELVTEDDLARARQDPAFRQKFLADHLDRLLEALNRARKKTSSDPKHALQIREGVDLAVKLADRLQKDGASPGPKAA
ncbi:MAG TPA: hypothetical protein VHD14_05595 [Pseudolabrys sp.]|nr:hypothetical protein [Pseudolabrys sp.]